MSDVTRILSQIESGDPAAAEQLLPLVYDELRKLAAAKLAQEKPGQTLQATALVHEAYLRLVGSANQAVFDGRAHFFAAAAEAMRRILVESARRKQSLKRGGAGACVEFAEEMVAATDQRIDLLELDDALSELERHDATAAQLVKLRYFAGFGHQEAAEALGIGRREADRLWALARAWLYQQLGDADA
jgi:RNA polymerase sigma factor (TIGR02999 family)